MQTNQHFLQFFFILVIIRKETVIYIRNSLDRYRIIRSCGKIKGYCCSFFLQNRQIILNHAPETGNNHIITTEKINIFLIQLEIRHDALFIITKHSVAIHNLHVGHSSCSLKYLHPGNIHTFALNGIHHLLTVSICTHRSDICSLTAKTCHINRHIHRIASRESLILFIVNIHAVVTSCCNSYFLHTNISPVTHFLTFHEYALLPAPHKLKVPSNTLSQVQ